MRSTILKLFFLIWVRRDVSIEAVISETADGMVAFKDCCAQQINNFPVTDNTDS